MLARLEGTLHEDDFITEHLDEVRGEYLGIVSRLHLHDLIVLVDVCLTRIDLILDTVDDGTTLRLAGAELLGEVLPYGQVSFLEVGIALVDRCDIVAIAVLLLLSLFGYDR